MDVHVASLGEFPHRPSMCPTIIVTETVREAGQHRLASIVQGHLPLQKEEDTKSSPFVQTERMEGYLCRPRPATPLMDKVTLY